MEDALFLAVKHIQGTLLDIPNGREGEQKAKWSNKLHWNCTRKCLKWSSVRVSGKGAIHGLTVFFFFSLFFLLLYAHHPFGGGVSTLFFFFLFLLHVNMNVPSCMPLS